MFVRLIRLLTGCVYVIFSGDTPERMLTVLSKSHLPFWNIKRRSGGIVVCMYARHFRKLRALRRTADVKVHILGRRGLPFVMNRYRLRLGFALGLACFLALNWAAGLFIWNINIEGNLNIPTAHILRYLKEQNVDEGSLASAVDCDNIRVKLTRDIEGISWASLSVEGSVLTVAVHERSPIDTSSPKPCNLVANADGIICDIRVLSGKTLVKKGDTISKGQLLVSGVVEYSTGQSNFVAAKGEISAYTTKDIVVRQPLSYTQTRRTGEQTRRSVFSFFGLKIPLYLGKVAQPHEKDVVSARPEANGAYLPISLTTAT
ncbi:MAG: sporulation protein YqfD, partial [Clostridia bacterium]|nr:sporulation protein YqfD [Clostridia bacterium]